MNILSFERVANDAVVVLIEYLEKMADSILTYSYLQICGKLDFA